MKLTAFPLPFPTSSLTKPPCSPSPRGGCLFFLNTFSSTSDPSHGPSLWLLCGRFLSILQSSVSKSTPHSCITDEPNSINCSSSPSHSAMSALFSINSHQCQNVSWSLVYLFIGSFIGSESTLAPPEPSTVQGIARKPGNSPCSGPHRLISLLFIKGVKVAQLFWFSDHTWLFQLSEAHGAVSLSHMDETRSDMICDMAVMLNSEGGQGLLDSAHCPSAIRILSSMLVPLPTSCPQQLRQPHHLCPGKQIHCHLRFRLQARQVRCPFKQTWINHI